MIESGLCCVLGEPFTLANADIFCSLRNEEHFRNLGGKTFPSKSTARCSAYLYISNLTFFSFIETLQRYNMISCEYNMTMRVTLL